jgi:hypothetical protein
LKKKLLLSRIEASKREVGDAEKHLTKALREVRNAPRAEKTTVTRTVEEAIGKLRVARAELDDLSKVISDDD